MIERDKNLCCDAHDHGSLYNWETQKLLLKCSSSRIPLLWRDTKKTAEILLTTQTCTKYRARKYCDAIDHGSLDIGESKIIHRFCGSQKSFKEERNRHFCWDSLYYGSLHKGETKITAEILWITELIVKENVKYLGHSLDHGSINWGGSRNQRDFADGLMYEGSSRIFWQSNGGWITEGRALSSFCTSQALVEQIFARSVMYTRRVVHQKRHRKELLIWLHASTKCSTKVQRMARNINYE